MKRLSRVGLFSRRGTTSSSQLRAFTIVELVVVIAVIGILATIVIVSYGAWQSSIKTSQVKNDLTQASTAMQSASGFGSGYPTTLPSSFTSASGLTTYTSSSGVTTTLYSSTASTFCIDGISTTDSTIKFYIDETHIKDQKAQVGTCATRTTNTIPAAPTNLAVSAYSTSVGLSWTAPTGTVSTYTMQCAEDGSFVSNMQQATTSATSGTVSGVTSKTAQFCRVSATNSAGTGQWSTVVTANTNNLSPPTGLAVSVQGFTALTLTWNTNSDAITYTAQCAKDSGFSSGLLGNTVSTTTTQINGLDPSTPYYCRVKISGSTGDSNWSSTVTTATTDVYGSIPIATSIEGYWTSSTPPTGYLWEDGSAVSRTTYASLFAIIGTTYGSGDGSTTFNVPDSRGRTYVNRLASDAYFGSVGQTSGAKTVQITTNQIPSHSHVKYSGAIDDKNFTGYQIAGQIAPGDGPGTTATGITTGSTGGDAAHNNIQPSIAEKFAIKWTNIDTTADTLPAATSIHGYWTSTQTDYALEDGGAISRTGANAPLYSAIGTTYGTGDGSTTFNVPDSTGRASVNISASDSEFNTMGEKYGEETHTLTINEMPSHNHAIFVGTVDDKNWTGYTVGSNQYPPGDAAGTYNTGLVTANTGGGTSFLDIQPSITQKAAIKRTAAVGTQPVPAGTSVSGYFTSVPSGYLAEDGSAVSRSGYAALFAAIGTTYGAGDGSTTFNVPDSRGRVGVNLSPTDSEFNSMGEKYGEKTHLLTIAELPSHTHQLYVGTADDQNFSNLSGQYPPADGPGAYNTGETTGPVGGGVAFNVIQPSITKRFVIKY